VLACPDMKMSHSNTQPAYCITILAMMFMMFMMVVVDFSIKNLDRADVEQVNLSSPDSHLQGCIGLYINPTTS